MRRRLLVVLTALAAALAVVVGSTPASSAVSWYTSAESVYEPGRNGGQYYAYAPSVITEGGKDHYWTCHNRQSGVVEDDIYYTRKSGSNYEVDRSVLSRSSSGWDSFHVCDPSVVRIDVTYAGTRYQYAMFYLGNDINCSCHNQIGVAFSNSLGGPWVKYPSPLVTYGDTSRWGVGQPSATTVDVASGRVLLFYTADDNLSGITRDQYDGSQVRAYRRDVVLGNMNAVSVGAPVQITTAGLTGTNGGQDYLNGFDVAYDPSRDRFYTVREMHPYPTDDPWYIGTGTQVASIAGSSIWNGGGSWQVEANITPGVTGFARNHNAGIQRTVFGTLPNSSSISVVFTDATTGPGNLWSYSLHRITGSIS